MITNDDSDTLSYVTLLSQRFFALLAEACAAFDALFADQVNIHI